MNAIDRMKEVLEVGMFLTWVGIGACLWSLFSSVRKMTLEDLGRWIEDKLQGKPTVSVRGLGRSHEWWKYRRKHLQEEPRCQWCLSAKRLEVHHEQPFHEHPEKELDDNNLITLCEGGSGENCHFIHGHGRNWKSSVPTVREDCNGHQKEIINSPNYHKKDVTISQTDSILAVLVFEAVELNLLITGAIFTTVVVYLRLCGVIGWDWEQVFFPLTLVVLFPAVVEIACGILIVYLKLFLHLFRACKRLTDE
jgi:hypothetical protein